MEDQKNNCSLNNKHIVATKDLGFFLLLLYFFFCFILYSICYSYCCLWFLFNHAMRHSSNKNYQFHQPKSIQPLKKIGSLAKKKRRCWFRRPSSGLVVWELHPDPAARWSLRFLAVACPPKNKTETLPKMVVSGEACEGFFFQVSSPLPWKNVQLRWSWHSGCPQP